MKNKQLFGSSMLLLASLFWGLSYSVQSLAYGLGTFTVSFFKCAGGIVLLAIAIIKKERFNSKTIIGGLLIGAVACIGTILQQKGLELTSAANASFLTALYIVFTPLLSIAFGKKINKRICIAILIALLGMYFLCIDEEFVLKTGDLIVVLAAVFFAIQTILIDRYINDVDPIAFTSVQQVSGAIFAGIIMLIVEKPSSTTIINCLPHVLYLSLISGALAQLMQNRFQRDVNPSLSSILMSFESVFGALFGWLILNQALSIKEIVGCILMFVAMLIAE